MELSFYDGFEGEVEYVIQHQPPASRDSPAWTLRLWEGDFDKLMERASAVAGGERGIVSSYRAFEWLDEEPWSDPDIHDTLSQMVRVTVGQPRRKAIAEAYVALLRRAASMGGKVLIWTT